MLENQLLKKTNICKMCFEEIEVDSFHSILNKDAQLCFSCLRKLGPKFIHFKTNGVKCISIFYYNDYVKEKLYNFKGCFDYELRSTFLDYYVKVLKLLYAGYVIVPAPSAKNKNEKRGFNHVVEIFSFLKLPIIEAIEKTEDIKQADLSSIERATVIKRLKITLGNQLKGKKVLICDDVYTTGSTVRAMIDLIKPYKPKKIKILVISKTKDIEIRENES